MGVWAATSTWVEMVTVLREVRSPYAAGGQARFVLKGVKSDWSNPLVGEASSRPNHSVNGTLTALPIIFHRCPAFSSLSLRVTFVQFGSNPWSRSASLSVGVPARLVAGSKTAGGDGIPIVDPPLMGGMPSRTQPTPRFPSVQ